MNEREQKDITNFTTDTNNKNFIFACFIRNSLRMIETSNGLTHKLQADHFITNLLFLKF